MTLSGLRNFLSDRPFQPKIHKDARLRVQELEEDLAATKAEIRQIEDELG